MTGSSLRGSGVRCGTTAVLGALVATLFGGCGHPNQAPLPSRPPAARAPVRPPEPGPADTRPPREATPLQREATLDQVGLDASAIDETADPCVDFYQFACGGWLRSARIPDGETRWDRFLELRERNRHSLQELLEGTSTVEDASLTAARTFYASCMNEAAVNAAGTTAIAPLLRSARKVTNPASLASALAKLHRYGIPAAFEPSSAPDFAHPDRQILLLDSAGLGLPDRSYYLIGRAEHDALRAAYRQHLRAVFELLGMKTAVARRAAEDVMRIETALAKGTKSRVERRMVDRLYNRVDRAGLTALAPHFPWPAYLRALGLGRASDINVTTPRFFRRLDALLARFQPSVWRHYLIWQIINATAPLLPKRFARAQRSFRADALGEPQVRSRREYCLAEVDTAMGNALGAAWARGHLSEPDEQSATRLLREVSASMRARIDEVDWLRDDTRAAALAKLDQVQLLVGAPDEPDHAVIPKMRAKTFAANALAAREARTRDLLDRVGKTTDRRRWWVSATRASPSYDWLANALTIPAGFLQPPFFSARRSATVNLGAMGAIAAHELIHAFDDRGAMFDGSGKLAQWWQPEDAARYQARSACLVEQLGAQEVSPGVPVDGRRALAESVADLGGLRLAFATYARLAAADAEVVTAAGLSEDQQFFLAVGQTWCSAERAGTPGERAGPGADVPARVRLHTALSNLPEFAEAFSCAPDAPLRRALVCSVW